MRLPRGSWVGAVLIVCGLSSDAAGFPRLWPHISIAREKWSVGVLAGGQSIHTDDGTSSSIGPGLHFFLMQRFSPKFSATLDAGYTELDGENRYHLEFFTEMLNLNLVAQVRPVEIRRLRPLVNVGIGLFNFQYLNGDRYFDGEALLGAGIEVAVTPQLAVQLNVNRHWTTGDDLDGVRGGGKDGYLAVRTGVVWHAGEWLWGRGKARQEVPEPVAEVGGSKQAPPPAWAAPAPPVRLTLADSVRRKLEELERRVLDQEQKVETLRRVVEEKRELIERLEQEIAALGPRTSPSAAAAGDFDPRYREALQLYMDHQYEQAIRAFSSLVRDFPNHNYVSNCHYWIGECYFVLGDYQQAIRAFERVLNYSGSPKMDDALLMLGRAHLKLGDTNQAAYYLDRLVREFPDSEYVQKARQYQASVR